MNPQAPPPQYPNQSEPVQVRNPLSVMQSGEQNICEINRHPIGLIGMYVSASILLIVVAVLAFVVGPLVFTDNRTQVVEIGALVFLLVAIFTAAFLLISHKVYLGNRWILTTDSLTQVLQRSLFDKQSSQLSLGNLEDVTVQQDGILAHAMNFGVLRVETAGERSKFVLNFCPKPNFYAQQILEAREVFEQQRRGDQAQPAAAAPVYQQAPPNGAQTPFQAPPPPTAPQ